jgi:hypothetical protein
VTVNRPTFRECFSSLWKLRDKGGREHPTTRARCSGTASMTCPFARFEDYRGARQFPSMGDVPWIRAKTFRVQRISWESAPDWRAISEHYDIAIPTPGIPTVVSMRSDVSNGWRATLAICVSGPTHGDRCRGVDRRPVAQLTAVVLAPALNPAVLQQCAYEVLAHRNARRVGDARYVDGGFLN